MPGANRVNHLYYGDCLTVMQDQMRSASVDLIYLDPPFNSNRQYNSIYKDETGRPLPDQVDAFCDMWELDEESERLVRQMPVVLREAGVNDEVAEFWRIWTKALRQTQPSLLAYLSYMVQRLAYMKGLLKPTGSIYLHCDPTASHYIKVMMDGIFGHQNFQNEITWQRTESHNTAERYGNIADSILFYANGPNPTWNGGVHKYAEGQKFSDAQMKRYKQDPDGRWYKLENLTAPRPNSDSGKFRWRGAMPGPTRGWGYREEQLEAWWAEGRIKTKRDGKTPRLDGLKMYLDEAEGKALQNIWTDVPRIPNNSAERMGYDTQKPLALLKRIIKASSNEGDVVFDPFCGCATTLEAAHELKRQWIGVDVAIHAIKRVARVRLQERLGLVEGKDFVIDGVPRTTEGAHDLWKRDSYHFQKWAVEEVDGFVTTNRTADGGIDGRLYFDMPAADRPFSDDLQSMIIEVKGGANVNIGVVRDLRGSLERDEALMAGLIVMELGDRKAKNFRKEMAAAGDLEVRGVPYPRMQLLTVQDILKGERFKTPGAVGRHTLEPRLPGLAH